MCTSSLSPSLRRAILLAAMLLCALTIPVSAAVPTAAQTSLPEAADSTWPWCGTTFIITGLGDKPIIYDGSAPEPDLTGYPLVFLDDGRTRTLGTAARQNLTIRHEGEFYTGVSDLEPLPAVFRHLGFTVGSLEGVLVEVSRGRIDVTVGSDLTYYERNTEEYAYQTIRQPNPSMMKGEEDVVQVGTKGEKGRIDEVVWSNGRELSRQTVEILNNEPINEIVEYGTAKPVKTSKATNQTVAVSRNTTKAGGVLSLPNGGSLRFTRAISMTATAYTAGHDSAGYYTAIGTPVRRGIVAVDPRVIPLGTKLYVVANGGIVYGKAVAEDTGVRGNCIDLYFDTYQQCVNFGRRSCMVYILE